MADEDFDVDESDNGSDSEGGSEHSENSEYESDAYEPEVVQAPKEKEVVKIAESFSPIPITVDYVGKRILNMSAYQEVNTERFGCPPGRTVARLATIKEDNAYHTVLQALLPKYRTLSYRQRMVSAKTFKKQLIDIMGGEAFSKFEVDGFTTGWFGKEFVKDGDTMILKDISMKIADYSTKDKMVKVLENPALEHLIPIMFHLFKVGTIVVSNPGYPRYLFGKGKSTSYIIIYKHTDAHDYRYETMGELVDRTTGTISTNISAAITSAPADNILVKLANPDKSTKMFFY